MKRFKNLYSKITSFENLVLASIEARKGKRYQPNVTRFHFRLEWELLALKAELETQAYQPGEYRSFYIFDPKKRMISAAPYRDRVVHHALCNVIQPLFERSFIDTSYANRKGKGSHAAIRKCQEYLHSNQYVLKSDIRKYFPSIDHAVLKEEICRKIGCQKTLWLIDLIIDNSNEQEGFHTYFEGDDLFTPFKRRKGLPIGNLTSQYFANIYLNRFDHFVKEKLKIKHYIRYVDDFVLFGDSKEELRMAQNQIEAYLANYRLLLHPKKTHIFPTKNGVTFLGQRIFDTHRLLKKENVRRFRKRLKDNNEQFHKGKLKVADFECRLNSWLGHAKQADTFRLQNTLYFEIKNKGLNLVKTDRFAWRLLEQQYE